MRTARPLKVGLLWHSPNSGNLGVGALTVANLAIAREAAADVGMDVEFTIIGMADRGARYVSDSEARLFTINTKALFSPTGCWRVLGAQDCVLDIGAGDSFADIYGAKRFVYMWLTKIITLARGTPLVLSPQTIGPFTRAPYIQLAGAAMTRADAVVARDDVSLQFLQDVAPRANGIQSVDVAFALPFEDRSAQRGAGERLRVGVNVSGLLFGEAVSGQNRFGLSADYAALMRGFLDHLTAQPNIEVHLVTHANGFRSGDDDDGWITDQLAQEFPAAIRVPDFESPSAAKSYISGLDFLVAGRMHACIAAYSSGTPVVPIAYSRKFSGLFGMLKYPWMVPVKGMTTDEALGYLKDCLFRRNELATDSKSGMTRVADLLEPYRAVLRDLFRRLGDGRRA